MTPTPSGERISTRASQGEGCLEEVARKNAANQATVDEEIAKSAPRKACLW